MRTPPYLPFLKGPPAFVVGLTPIDPAGWLAPDPEAASLAEKRAWLSANPGAHHRARAGADAMEAEAAALVGQALGVDFGAGAEAFLLAACAVSDDLVILAPSTGGWRVESLVLCSPTFFSLDDAFAATLAALHGPVPDRLGPEDSQALALRIGRVFDHLRPDMVLERFNWTVQAGGARFTPRQAPLIEIARASPPAAAAALLHLRVERQTIRRMPETGGVIFTIRVSLDPLAPILRSGANRAAFAAAWAGAPAHVRAYKKWAAYEPLVAHLLSEIGEDEAQEGRV